MIIPTKKAGDFELPVLGFGTWNMGGGYFRTPFHNDSRDISAIRVAIEAGITHIDTAEMYAGGHAEELVGQVIKVFDRERLFITTKVWWTNLAYDDLIRAARGSLDRLGVEKIDLYLIHGPNPDIEISETMRAMDYLVDNELARFIGVSNFDKEKLAEAQAASKHKIVNNQIHYNLTARDYEKNGTLEFCKDNDILVTAYRPLGFGRAMTGGLSADEVEVLKGLSEKYDKTPAQVALNWLTNEPNVVTIFKSTNPSHIHENLGALGWQLEEQDQKMLKDSYVSGFTKNVGVHPGINKLLWRRIFKS